MADEKNKDYEDKGSGQMTVEEAGHKGGQRVKELIEEGKEEEQEEQQPQHQHR